MSECNKRVIQKRITPQQFQKEIDSLYKWWRIEYIQSSIEEPDVWITREYHNKFDAQRLLDAQTTSSAMITVMEVVDDG